MLLARDPKASLKIADVWAWLEQQRYPVPSGGDTRAYTATLRVMFSRGESFPGRFDNCVAVGPERGNSAFFGRDVLRGLVDGIDDYVSER